MSIEDSNRGSITAINMKVSVKDSIYAFVSTNRRLDVQNYFSQTADEVKLNSCFRSGWFSKCVFCKIPPGSVGWWIKSPPVPEVEPKVSGRVFVGPPECFWLDI